MEKPDENDVVQRGLRLGVAGMLLGETSHFRIEPSYAFGEQNETGKNELCLDSDF